MRSLNTSYLSRLDHLRFYAAALVLVHHYFRQFVDNTAFRNPLGSLINEGHTGIGLFMVVSGFIFSVIATGKHIAYGRFIFNRFLRIYPLYIFMATLAVTIMIYNQGQHHLGAFDIIAWLLAFRPPTIAALTHFSHLWTIPVEFSFYLLFPFLHFFYRKHGIKYFAGLITLLILIRWAVYLEFGSVRYLAYETLFGRLDQFLLGYLCGQAYVSDTAKRVVGNPLALLLSIALTLITIRWMNQHGGSHNFEARWWVLWPLAEGLCWALVTLTYLQSRIGFPKVLDKALARFGELSFSMYIVHYFIVLILAKHVGVFNITGQGLIDIVLTALLIPLPLTILISTLTFRLIEKPFLSFRVVYTRSPEADRPQ